MRRFLLAIALAACGSPHRAPDKVKPAVDNDPDGPHRAAIAALIQPVIDGEIASGIVVAVYDGGKREIYGFGAGPNDQHPDGRTLFEIGSVTKVYTSLLLADAVQRHEVALDTPVAELLPPGVTVPTQDKQVITLKELALHTSGLPRLPPSLLPRGGAELADPYAKYNEDRLYADLVRTPLEHPPGAVVSYSNYGVGLLGFALGRKLGGGYAAIVEKRVLAPLGLRDTFVTVPAAAKPRRAVGTNDDLAPVAPWTFDALAGAGAIVSTARDQLQLVEAELDAAAGSREPLRPAMRMTQEGQLEIAGENEGLGWQIDAQGRMWHNGETGGFHAFVGFDPKTRRAVVLLASTALPLLDKVADDIYKLLAGEKVQPPVLPNEDQLAQYAGTYDLAGDKVTVTAQGKRLHVELQGAPKLRAIPVSDKTFFLAGLQALAAFERDDQARVVRIVFFRGEQRITATRVP
jgi:CubicO group peptidase (beta-lactamase class C family)